LLAKPVLDSDILSLNPTKLAQLLPKRLQEYRATGGSASIQVTYAGDFPLSAAPRREGKAQRAWRKA
jgi:hypothetical protein